MFQVHKRIMKSCIEMFWRRTALTVRLVCRKDFTSVGSSWNGFFPEKVSYQQKLLLEMFINHNSKHSHVKWIFQKSLLQHRLGRIQFSIIIRVSYIVCECLTGKKHLKRTCEFNYEIRFVESKCEHTIYNCCHGIEVFCDYRCRELTAYAENFLES